MKILLILLIVIGYFLIGYTVIRIAVQYKLVKISKYSGGVDETLYTIIFPIVVTFYGIKAGGEWLHKKVESMIKLDFLKRLRGGKRDKLTSAEQWVGWVDIRVGLNEQQKEYTLFGMKEFEKNIRDDYKTK